MTESNIAELMQAQARGKAGVVPLGVVELGPLALAQGIDWLRSDGVNYAVVDAVTDQHLNCVAEATMDIPLLTGSSGLGRALASRLSRSASGRFLDRGRAGPRHGPTVILSGSCAEMTNRQVAAYRGGAAWYQVDVARCLAGAEAYADAVVEWIVTHLGRQAPLVNATVGPDELREMQRRHGAVESAAAVEDFFRRLAVKLRDRGFVNFIVAGGETAGAVAGALGMRAFRIGPVIAPGVSWVETVDGRLALAMKSGSFGDIDFFRRAQDLQET